ncbi:MAG: hypothetical protein LLG14_20340 [Nocardiaceae bacterium]|nr:hypothetical protein [Nocardiaceae bacterium]
MVSSGASDRIVSPEDRLQTLVDKFGLWSEISQADPDRYGGHHLLTQVFRFAIANRRKASLSGLLDILAEVDGA